MTDPSADTLRTLLLDTRRIAIVGLSARADRPSNQVARYLIAQGYTVVPVNPAYEEVLGLICYPSLHDIPEPVDMVDVFRRSAEVAAVADAAIVIGARSLWLQLGVIDHEAAGRARAAGLQVVMDRCIKIEHARPCGGTTRTNACSTQSTARPHQRRRTSGPRPPPSIPCRSRQWSSIPIIASCL